MRRAIAAFVLLLLMAAPAAAHRLKVFATVEDGVIGGYGFFVGGGRPQGSTVTIRDGGGQVVFKGATGAEGQFSWRPAVAADYVVAIDTREGHMAESRLSVDRFGGSAGVPGPAVAVAPANAAPSQAGHSTLEQAVDAAVARQMRPLLERIEMLDARLRLVDIISGICLILGLGGMSLWAVSRRTGGPGGKRGSGR